MSYSDMGVETYSGPAKDANGTTMGTVSGGGAYTSSGQAQSNNDGRIVYDFLGGTTSVDLSSTASGTGSDWNYGTVLFEGSGTQWAGYVGRLAADSRSSGSFASSGSFQGEYDSEGDALTETLSSHYSESGTASGWMWQRDRQANGLEGTALASLTGAFNAHTDLDATWCGDELDTATISAGGTSSGSIDATQTVRGPLEIANGTGSIDASANDQAESSSASSLEVAYEAGEWAGAAADSYDGSGHWSFRSDWAAERNDPSLGSRDTEQIRESGSGSWSGNEALTSTLQEGETTDQYEYAYTDGGTIRSARDGTSLRTNSHGKKRETASSAKGQATWLDDVSASYERTTPANPTEGDPPPQWTRTDADFHSERSLETSYHDHVRDEGYFTMFAESGDVTYLGTTDATGWTRSSSVVSGTPGDYTYVTRDASRHQIDSVWNASSTWQPTEGQTYTSTSSGDSTWVGQSRDNRNGRVVNGVASESLIDIYRSSDGTSHTTGSSSGGGSSSQWSGTSRAYDWTHTQGSTASGSTSAGWGWSNAGTHSWSGPEGGGSLSWSGSNAASGVVGVWPGQAPEPGEGSGEGGSGQNQVASNGGGNAPQQNGVQAPVPQPPQELLSRTEILAQLQALSPEQLQNRLARDPIARLLWETFHRQARPSPVDAIGAVGGGLSRPVLESMLSIGPPRNQIVRGTGSAPDWLKSVNETMVSVMSFVWDVGSGFVKIGLHLLKNPTEIVTGPIKFVWGLVTDWNETWSQIGQAFRSNPGEATGVLLFGIATGRLQFNALKYLFGKVVFPILTYPVVQNKLVLSGLNAWFFQKPTTWLGRWFRYWADSPAKTVSEWNGVWRYRVVEFTINDVKYSLGWVDSFVHEGWHVLTNFIPGWKGFVAMERAFPIAKWIEESIAYSLGHLATLRLHGVVLAPLEAFFALKKISEIVLVIEIGGIVIIIRKYQN